MPKIKVLAESIHVLKGTFKRGEIVEVSGRAYDYLVGREYAEPVAEDCGVARIFEAASLAEAEEAADTRPAPRKKVRRKKASKKASS